MFKSIQERLQHVYSHKAVGGGEEAPAANDVTRECEQADERGEVESEEEKDASCLACGARLSHDEARRHQQSGWVQRLQGAQGESYTTHQHVACKQDQLCLINNKLIHS